MKNGTVMNRFQVTCLLCGQVDYPEATLKNALTLAKRMEHAHNSEGEEITVYDRMAHIGRPELWNPNGRILSVRGNGTDNVSK